MRWPYAVSYEREEVVRCDVLVLGGGIAGCHAAINAARKGANVVVVDKGPTIRSGSGGAGVDHWHLACTNPCSLVTPEEMIEELERFEGYSYAEYGNGITAYITCKESYDTLLDVETMGVKVRDLEDRFVGAPFRDDSTKLLFAYDYEKRHNIRVNGGADIKVALFKELKRQGVGIYERIMVTRLLTAEDNEGKRVVGAMGVNVRTGAFYIFLSKATVLSMGPPSGLWIFSTELNGLASIFGDPNNTGEGTAAAWEAGVELTLMEGSSRALSSGGFRYPLYGTGDCHNTWYPCNIVDAEGKEVPWVGRDGRVLADFYERVRCAEGQRFFFYGRRGPYAVQGPDLIPDLSERIRSGEFVLPLFADLPGLPEPERRVIWGFMIYEEGKTRIIYDTYTKAGFDPGRDMLQIPIMPPEEYGGRPFWEHYGPPQWREGPSPGIFSGGGILFDWDLATNLKGLYVAGTQGYAGGDHSQSACTGRYAGRKAASYARRTRLHEIERRQIEEEKERVYAFVKRKDGISWKEFRAGMCRVMQDYCGEFKSAHTLELGLRLLRSLRENEARLLHARNPHELMRVLECTTLLTIGEVVFQACLARKASSRHLNFYRLDYPTLDPPEWYKLVTLRLEGGEVKFGERPVRYWLLPPCSSSYEENYRQHCEL
jgi:succinate dehydrogenase/fumarate reductase flavoprotein subunit